MKIAATVAALVAATGIMGGCAYQQPYAVYDRPVSVYDRPMYAERVEYGVVESIDVFRDGSSAPNGVGAIVGGLAGGLLGHQIGGGRGNTAATIAGAVWGAVVGNEVQRGNARERYRVTVLLDNGARVELADMDEGQVRVGDRVRIVNNRIYRA